MLCKGMSQHVNTHLFRYIGPVFRMLKHLLTEGLSSALRAIGPRKSIPRVDTLISTKKDPQITFVTPAGLRSPAFYSYLFHCSRISLNIYNLILRILRQIPRKNRTFRIRLSKKYNSFYHFNCSRAYSVVIVILSGMS